MQLKNGESIISIFGEHKRLEPETINFSLLLPQIHYWPDSMAGTKERLFLPVKDMGVMTRKRKKLILVTKLKENQC